MNSRVSKWSSGLGALLALRVCCLVAIAASAALTVEYRSADASFCTPGSGCSILRRTGLAHLWGLGLTLPELGLVAFSLLYGLTLTRHVAVAATLSVVGGLAGLALIAVQQFQVQVFCWLCLIVDLAAIGGAASAVVYLRARRGASEPPRVDDLLRPAAWVGLAALAVAAPALWPTVKPAPPVPAGVRAFYVPGKINVVEFADFECPFCRHLHRQLKAQLAPYGDRVNFVRLNMPLDRHPHARGAALAVICAEPSGKADALADFLFTSEALDSATIRAEAGRLGIDLGEFDRCLRADSTRQRLEREQRILHDAGFEGLPTTYIGERRIVGAQSPEVFQDALDRAAEATRDPGVPPWAYLLVVLAIATLIVHTGRPSRPDSR